MDGMTYHRTMISPRQIRAARQLLGWLQSDLSSSAGVSLSGIRDIERGARDPRVSTVAKIEAALKAAGVRFFDEDETGGEGVRLVRRPQKDRAAP